MKTETLVENKSVSNKYMIEHFSGNWFVNLVC